MDHQRYCPDHDACGVGFVTQLGGSPSHEIVDRALTALMRLAHRGGVDADGRSGDGAGLLMPIPEAFMRERALDAGICLPEAFGLGMAFLPSGAEAPAKVVIEALATQNSLRFLGWRVVPTDPSIIGPRAVATLPTIWQCFFGPTGKTDDLESSLFRLRKQIEAQAPRGTYFCSLSSRTVVYKGLLTPDQLAAFYRDLADPAFKTSFAIFHQRYSTNTQPSWSLAQPFRFVAHNGEINTISANRRWLHAKQRSLKEALQLPDSVCLLEPGVSDSASFDNGLELFVRRGYSGASGMLAMVPPAWETNPQIPADVRRFLEAHAPLQEPWDGPAAMVFTDGHTVGAKLDRNGLRPLRYTLTSDGLLVVGSEVGIADLHDKKIVERQRLGPGEMLVCNPCTGSFTRPTEIGDLFEIREASPAAASLHVVPTEKLPQSATPEPQRAMAALGWTEDQYRLLFQPLVLEGQEAVWSMGDDAPPAFLSRLPRPLWDYCKQRFAQVTNPPIDPLRETYVMSLRMFLGERAVLSSPLLDSGQLDGLAEMLLTIHSIDMTFEAERGIAAAREVLSAIRKKAAMAAAGGRAVLLSDRSVSQHRAALPALLAVSAAWHGMTSAGGWNVPLIVETGQAFDTHHIALLIATGASAVHPYPAMGLAARANSFGPVNGPERYRLGIEKGLRKVLARMGISTMSSYRNSQIFETVGIDAAVCEEFFEDAGQTLGGTSLGDLLRDCISCHTAAFGAAAPPFRDAGLYRFRRDGEQHASSPELVRRMHRFIRSPTPANQMALAELSGERKQIAVRDLLEFRPGKAISLDEVESEVSLLSRFSTQAMSLGAISPEAHQTLAIAMNRLGGRSNTG